MPTSKPKRAALTKTKAAPKKAAPAPAPAKYLKVLADGKQVPAEDPRTDHVAVLDTTRNLLIHVNSVGVKGERAPAKKLNTAIAKLKVLDGGWRMASREEAESILDLTRHSPAVDPNLFPGIQPSYHVTSTPAAWAPASRAWWVYFNYGDVSGYLLVYDGWALAVRPVGQ